MADRLRASLRPDDVVARLGGDEFAILLRRVPDLETVWEVAEQVRVALDEPLVLDGQLLDLEASMGIALVPDHATDYEQLLSRADIAMYVAKADRTGIELYDAERDGALAVPARRARRAAAGHRARPDRAALPAAVRRPGRSPARASRRWCAGATRCAAWSRRTTSSRWPSSPA